jgi:hypothetical protein
MSDSKRRAWFNDQYCGIPPVVPLENGLSQGKLFEPTSPGTRLDHFLVQAMQVIQGSREGGFFLMIARKPDPPATEKTARKRRSLHGAGRC